MEPAAEGRDVTSVPRDLADDELLSWWCLVIEGYLRTQERVTAEIEQRFKLAAAQVDVLLRLVRTPEFRMPMTKLAQETALSSGGFTKVADRLVALGLVRREPSETDRRVTYAVLTEQGQDLAGRARSARAEILRQRVLAPLGPEAAAALGDAMRVLRTVNLRPL